MADPVKDACEDCFDDNQNDCSAFVDAVADDLNITLTGQANDIVDTIRGEGGWVLLPDGAAAEQAAADGKFVVAGLKGSEQAAPSPHGHVVVVVAGTPLAHGKYPFAYWGSLNGNGQKNQTINLAWREDDRDSVSYAAHEIPDGGT
jgi:hypothetical protein